MRKRRWEMLNILVSCKQQKEPGGLEHIGQPYRVLYDTTPGWAAASNSLLENAALLGGDALFLDDDTVLTPTSLEGVHQYYADADLFGLDLHDMAGQRQIGARHVMDKMGVIHDWVEPGPAYVAHVSTSAIYIKEHVLQSALRFPVWDGIHWEDVAFCVNAWLLGFRVMAVPGYVHHAIVGGVGATKRHDAAFWDRWGRNRQAFSAWSGEHGVIRALADGRVPVGVKTLDEVMV